MKIIAVNGSPRKNKNTAVLLESALQGADSIGAEIELIHLYEFNYKGCISCFACKLKDGKCNGLCAYQDALSPILEKVLSADAIIFGSPVYYDTVTGQMRSFMERLMFPLDPYKIDVNTKKRVRMLEKTIPTALIYTMNAWSSIVEELGYKDILSLNEKALARVFGFCEPLYAFDTYQFNNYSKYDVNMFDEKHKAAVREIQFPLDCQKSFDLGRKLIEKATELNTAF